MIFVDDAGRVSARRWCWRQSRGSAVGEATRRILVTVEGHHENARSDVQAALADLQRLLVAHAGATIHATAVLDAAHPELALAGW